MNHLPFFTEALKTKFRGKLSSRSPLGELPKGGLHPLWRSLCSLLPPLLHKGASRRPLTDSPLSLKYIRRYNFL